MEELRLLVPEGTPTSKLQGIIISCKGDKAKLSIMVEDLWNSGKMCLLDFTIADSVDDGWEEIPDKVKSKVGYFLLLSKNRNIVQMNLLQQMGNHINLHKLLQKRRNPPRVHINQIIPIHIKIEQFIHHLNINQVKNLQPTRNMINQILIQITIHSSHNYTLDLINHPIQINL